MQVAADATSNLEKAHTALEELQRQEAALQARVTKVQNSQLLMVQKKRELASLNEQLQASYRQALFGVSVCVPSSRFGFVIADSSKPNPTSN